MKNNFLKYFCLFLILTSCNKLKDVELNNNPYDKDYVGPKVVRIDNANTLINGTFRQNRIYLTALTDKYNKVKLYRNGSLITTMNRVNFTNGEEVIIDSSSPAQSVSYSYQVALVLDNTNTSLSDSYSYLTQ